MEFFETAGRNIHAAEASAGVGHHVALSVVGTERLQASGYFRAKLAQENLIKTSGIPYTIVRATQFFEFIGGIADSATNGTPFAYHPPSCNPSPPPTSPPSSPTSPLPSVLFRLPPLRRGGIKGGVMAAIANREAKGNHRPATRDQSHNPPTPSPQPAPSPQPPAPPLNTTIDIAGPDPIRMDDLVRQYLAATSRSSPHTTLRSPLPAPRSVITDPTATYFGIPVNDQSLVPTGPARLGPTHFKDWLTRQFLRLSTSTHSGSRLLTLNSRLSTHRLGSYRNRSNPN